MRIRRSIFNNALEDLETKRILDNEEDLILSSLPELNLSKGSSIDNTINSINEIKEINFEEPEETKINTNKSTRKLTKYSVQIKVSKGREIRLVTYVIESDSKNQAGKLGRDKLIENGYEEDKIILCRVTKAKSNSKDEDTLFEYIKINYEVSFNIKIEDERFRKTFIIKAGTPEEATNLMILRCKKEFKGYRSINKVEVKEATKESKESSELIEAAVNNDDKDNINNNNEQEDDCSETTMNFLNEALEENLNNLPKDLAEMKIVKVGLSSKDKEAKKFLEERTDNCNFILKANSLEEAEREVEKVNKSLGVNRELRRKLKNNLIMTNFKEIIRENSKNYFDKIIKEIQQSNDNENASKNKEPKKHKNTEELIKELKEAFKRRFDEMVNDLIETLNEEKKKDNKEISGREAHLEVNSSNVKNLDIITNKNGDICAIKHKGRALFNNNKIVKNSCVMILKDGSECTPIEVEAETVEKAVELLTTAISAGAFSGLKDTDLDTIKVTSISKDRIRSSTVKVANVLKGN